MAAQRRKASGQPPAAVPIEGGGQMQRLTRLLALLVVKGESQPEKIRVLSSAGFANTEIADLLGLSANAVNVAIHRMRTRK